MNLVVPLLAAILQAQPIAPSEALVFKISAKTDGKPIVVGEQPSISIEIKNISPGVVYIDQSDLNINSAVSDPTGKVITLSETLVRADKKLAQPTPVGNWRLGPQTIELHPGHSITRVHRLPPINRPGHSNVLVVVSFPASPNIEQKPEDWKSVRLTTNIRVRAQAKKP